MELLLIFVLAITLSFDTFAASLAYGVNRPSIKFKEAVPLAIVFAIFQAGFFGLGFLSGTFLSTLITTYSIYLSSTILIILGLRMMARPFIEVFKEKKKPKKNLNLILLSIATSIDAVGAGVSFGLMYQNWFLASILIGMVTFIFSMASIRVGKFFGNKMERVSEIAGGAVLIILGVMYLISP